MTALRISRLACADLHEILAFVGERDLQAALTLVSTVIDRIDLLRNHPRMGRPGRVKGTRELIISGTRYIVAYRVVSCGDVEVLRVVHSSRRWPKSL